MIIFLAIDANSSFMSIGIWAGTCNKQISRDLYPRTSATRKPLLIGLNGGYLGLISVTLEICYS